MTNSFSKQSYDDNNVLKDACDDKCENDSDKAFLLNLFTLIYIIFDFFKNLRSKLTNKFRETKEELKDYITENIKTK